MRRIISIILCIILIFMLSPAVFSAEPTQSASSAYTVQSSTVTTQANASQNSFFSVYDVDLDSIMTVCDSITTSTKDLILSVCSLSSTEVVGTHTIQLYTSDTLADYLFNCAKITEISVLNHNHLYINYKSTDDMEIILCYGDDGLVNKAVYNTASDTQYYLSEDGAIVSENFIAGSHYEMTEEVETQIDTLIETNQINDLSNIEGIDVSTYADGSISIAPQAVSSSVLADFGSESAVLSDLQSDFVPYTNTTKANYTRYSNQLEKNIAVRIKESRNTYTKKSYDFKTFIVGTTITAIASYLGGPATLAVNILTGIGVGISAVDCILSAAKLCRSAVYTYTGSRIGYVYDTTLHNAYVRVVTYSSKGEFTGGYNSSAVFTWVHSTISSAYDHEYSDIADTVRYYYDSELIENGMCIDFVPD